MKRREVFRKIWRDCFGSLKPGEHIRIAGGGLSGLHLAYFFSAANFRVTLYEPAQTGGIRIPLMRACHKPQRTEAVQAMDGSPKARPSLWETAAAFSRDWYRRLAVESPSVVAGSSAHGIFFSIKTRSYLLHLKKKLILNGVEIRREDAPPFEKTGANLYCLAAGVATAALLPNWMHDGTRTIPGLETYFAGGKTTSTLTPNYISLPPRAGFIHANKATPTVAEAEALQLEPQDRRALFQAVRFSTRDRFPLIGFLPPATMQTYAEFHSAYRQTKFVMTKNIYPSPFLFCGMGYHGATYTPYLAEQVVLWLKGDARADENLICTLTPVRFLPR